jgi:NTP pyrophosphatase (non-canonical NTP hydrolase)
MTNRIDLNKYSDFVREVTSKESNYMTDFINRVHEVDLADMENDKTFINTSLLLTAAIGLAAEAGEFCEIPKKIFFQGKPYTESERFHMKRELGDIFWYWTNACRALDLDPNDVIAENVNKLESRYPGGKFDAFYSENRQDGDL